MDHFYQHRNEIIIYKFLKPPTRQVGLSPKYQDNLLLLNYIPSQK